MAEILEALSNFLEGRPDLIGPWDWLAVVVTGIILLIFLVWLARVIWGLADPNK